VIILKIFWKTNFISLFYLLIFLSRISLALGPRDIINVQGEVIIKYFGEPPTIIESDYYESATGKKLWIYKSNINNAYTELYSIFNKYKLLGVEPLLSTDSKLDKSLLSEEALRKSSIESNLHRLIFSPDVNIDEIIKELKQLPNVEYAEPNYIGTLCYTPSDPLYNQQSADLSIIGIEDAWTVQQGADSSILIAVIDSGIEKVHPDLNDALDLINSYNFVESNTNIFDDIGHGTRVAGIIAAEGNNAEGIAGIAFGASVISLDVADPNGVITSANVSQAINYAVSHNANIINMSLRFTGYSQTLENACDSAYSSGVLLVAAAGNENQGDTPVYPASFDSVIGVGAVMDDGTTRANWSNYNGSLNTLVEIVAPGETIFSTIPGSQYNGTLGSGTSFSAPMVSGTLALLKSKYPSQSAGALRKHLQLTTQTIPDNQPTTGWFGYGLLSVKKALETAMSPNIVFDKVTINDSKSINAGNDEDGIWDVGETVHLLIYLKDNGADTQSISGTLSTIDPDVTITDNSTFWDDISFNESKISTNNIENINISNTSIAHSVPFELSITAYGGYAANLSFDISVDNTFTPPTIIGTDTMWTSDKTYLISSNTVVMDSANLTIEPGTTIRFGPEGRLEVRGGIIANGTENAKITFSSINGMPGGGLDLQVTMAVGSDTFSVAIGDADNDGDNDIVTASASSNNVSLIRWNGTGFDPQVTMAAGSYPISVAIGDADNDGDNDIVTANGSDNNKVSLIRWNGTGFDPYITMAVGSYPISVAIGDADNDGDNDIVTANAGSNNVSLIRWNGAGFDPHVTMAVSSNTFSVAIGDADNDGDNDIVTANDDSNNVSLIRWNGTDFDPQITMTVGDSPRSVYIGDADNDGDNDIVTANYGSGNVSLICWNGTGFDPQVTMSVGSSPRSVAIGDADNDGDNDIVTANAGNVSLIRWNGIEFDPQVTAAAGSTPHSVAIGDADNDGDNDIVTANGDSNNVSLIRWNMELNGTPAYREFWIRSTASTAQFSHCRFQFAPVFDESSTSSFSDCLFDRTGSEYSFSTTSGTNSITNCEVRNNSVGDGIKAGNKNLSDCIVRDNKGIGLQGGILSSCEAYNNGSIGMIGSSGSNCIAMNNNGDGIQVTGQITSCTSNNNTGNGITTSGSVENSNANNNSGWGIYSSSTIQNCMARGNGNGINGTDISNCTAEKNMGNGISASGTATNCRSVDNQGTGLTGNGFTDCTVVRNASGLSLSGTALRCTVAQNNGTGINGGTIDSSVVHHNSGIGISSSGSVNNSWILKNVGTGILSSGPISNTAIKENLGNGIQSATSVVGCRIEENNGIGILGKVGSPYTSISNSAITENVGSGVKNSGAMNNCNIYNNGGTSGYDYEDSRFTSEIVQVDVTGNYWGPETTPIMDAHPWGTYYNIPRIYDFIDNTSLCEAKYANHLPSEVIFAYPDNTPPTFLLSVVPNLDNAINVGETIFTLVFSKVMNTTINPAVTFGLEAPYTTFIVEATPGWINNTTWQGKFWVQTDTGEGIHTIRVANATDLGGFIIPDDTAHQFEIDYSGALASNTGSATSTVEFTLNCSWSENGKPPTAFGYNIRRSQSGVAGTYQRMNESILTNPEYIDTGLNANTTYYYIVDIIDSNYSSTQWTPPFIGTTTSSNLPDPPSYPFPEDDEINVLISTDLDWADAARAINYNLYFWNASETKPSIPTASNLTISEYDIPGLLPYVTTYNWQVISKNTYGNTEGSIWSFTTQAFVTNVKNYELFD